MRSARVVFAAAVMCLALSAGYSAQQARDNRAEVALQAAIKIETIDGDLKAAIEAYKRVVAAYESNRSVAAQALAHMGQCYEKLGAAETQEARKAYERLVQQYPDQKDLVAQVRARLAGSCARTFQKLLMNSVPRVVRMWYCVWLINSLPCVPAATRRCPNACAGPRVRHSRTSSWPSWPRPAWRPARPVAAVSGT